jgi:hypothetical protein
VIGSFGDTVQSRWTPLPASARASAADPDASRIRRRPMVDEGRAFCAGLIVVGVDPDNA